MKLDFLRNEKGSITVYVLVAMLFILAIVFGRYILANRQLQTQVTAIKQVKTIYEANVKEYDDDTNTITSPTTSPTTSPSISPTPSSGGGNSQNEGIDIEIGTNPVPIYNYNALKYFLDGGTGPYYVYQEGKNYNGGASATFKLYFDITIPEQLSRIVTTTGYNNRSFSNNYNMLNNLDFNNHCIYTSDGSMIFRNNGTIVVK